LRNVRKTDELQLQTATGVLRYEVDWVKVVRPDDISVLGPSADSALTLVTCYPFYFLGSASDRFIVHARLIRASW
jgi:sortase A